MKYSHVKVPLIAAKSMAKALLPHAARDRFLPSLYGAWVTGTYAYSTDRYSVCRYDLTNLIDPVDEPLLLTTDALKTIAALGRSILPFGTLAQAELVAEQSATAVEGRTLLGVTVLDGYMGDDSEGVWFRAFLGAQRDTSPPPVDRLFDEFRRGAQESFTSAAREGGSPLGKFASTAGSLRLPIRVTMPEQTQEGSKIKPVLVEIGDRIKGLFAPQDDSPYNFGAPLGDSDNQTPDGNTAAG